MQWKRWWYIGLLIFISVWVAGCSIDEDVEVENEATNETGNRLSLNEKTLLIASEGELIAFDPETKETVSLRNIGQDERPPLVDFDTFKKSPSGKYIVWHSPQLGLLKLDVTISEMERVYKPSEWFSSNAYFTFDPIKDYIYLVDDEGKTLLKIDVENDQQEMVDIPYPFGTLFYLSPDLSTVLFISGFGQSQDNPEYMMTSIDGKDQRLFETGAEITDRNQVVWSPDSSGVIAIENKNQLYFYPKDDLGKPEQLIELDEERIIHLFVSNDGIMAESINGNWYLIDFETASVQAVIPAEIANELNDHRLVPYGDRQFIIEETIRTDPEQFKRLWLSDFYGNKFVVIPEYQRTVVRTDTVPL